VRAHMNTHDSSGRSQQMVAIPTNKLALWTLAVGRPAGAPQGNKNAAKIEEPTRETTLDNIQGCLKAPTGTSAAAGLRRLHAAATPIIDASSTARPRLPRSQG
jgi:hypothetical protein